MKSKFLVLCLVGTLFANTAYSYSSERKATIGIVISSIALFIGAASTVFAFIPQFGSAAEWGPRWCGDDKTLCVDSCTGGCLNMEKLVCEEWGDYCKGNRWCMRSVDSYHFVNSTTECAESRCTGWNGMCIAEGKEVVPWNLRDPESHFLGHKWAIAPAIVGPILVIISVIGLVKYSCFTNLLPDDEIPLTIER